MTDNNKFVVIGERNKGSKWICYFFVGIIVFLAFYFPFFALNLRYSTGVILTHTFNTIGFYCILFGVIFIKYNALKKF